jgi:peroxiredoxin
MKTLLKIAALLLISATAIAGIGSLKPYTGDLTPTLELADLDGKVHNLADYKDRVVMVQFWATYCTPCRTEMPSMNRLQAQLGEENFKILAVDMAETEAEVRAFVEEVKPEFTILMDESGESIGAWQVFAAPSSFIIDTEGKIRYTLFGGVEWDDPELIKQISELIPKK